MLVLARKIGERVVIKDNIIVEVLQINSGQIKLGFDAPKEVLILREELTNVSGQVNQSHSS